MERNGHANLQLLALVDSQRQISSVRFVSLPHLTPHEYKSRCLRAHAFVYIEMYVYDVNFFNLEANKEVYLYIADGIIYKMGPP